MKSSRAMLLTAILFVAPVFCSENAIPTNSEQASPATPPAAPATPPTTPQAPPVVPVKDKTLLQKAAVPFVFVATQATNATDFVANWTVNPVLNGIVNNVSFLNRFKGNVPTVGRVMVITAALYAAYKAHEAYNAQDVDANDDDAIFYEDTNN